MNTDSVNNVIRLNVVTIPLRNPPCCLGREKLPTIQIVDDDFHSFRVKRAEDILAVCVLVEHDRPRSAVQEHILLVVRKDQTDIDADHESWFAWLLIVSLIQINNLASAIAHHR